MEYLCSCGNKSSISLKKLLLGQKCAECGNVQRAKARRKYTIETARDIFLQAGWTLTAQQFVSVVTPMSCLCPMGHKRNVTLSNFVRGHRCQKCVKTGINNWKWNSNRKQVRQNELFRKKAYNLLARSLNATGQVKSKKTKEMLGYSTKELVSHIQNHPEWPTLKESDWHLDHIFPIKAFMDAGINDMKKINALENLRPCAASENLSKQGKYDLSEFQKWLETHFHD